MSEVLSPDKLARIRYLNDLLRVTFAGGIVVTSRNFANLCAEVKAVALGRVRTFSRFTKDNDPHEEHDGGAFFIGQQNFIWKIEYFDKSMTFGSEDPSNEEVTTRVLTVMLGEDM